jgi:hypothetical protein
MGDDHGGVGRKGLDRIAVDLMAGNHVVGDAMQLDRVVGDDFAGLVERTKGIEHRADAAVGLVGKLDHAELDHLVRGGIKPCGFHIEQDGDFGELR